MSLIVRSVVRAGSRAARSTSIKPSVGFVHASRNLTVSKRLAQREFVAEKEVPLSSYINDGTPTPDRKILPVNQLESFIVEDNAQQDVPKPLIPLTDAVHQSLNSTMKNFTLKGKSILITGGARGLGNNMARATIEAGAKSVVIFDANQELGDEAAAELHNATGIPVLFYKVDVRDELAIAQAINSVVEKFGAPDVVINSAGIADSNIKAEDYDPGMFRRLIDINLNGTFMVCQAVAKVAIAAGKPCSMVLVASMSGSIVNYPQEQSAYNASKAGVVHLGKSLAAEWAKNSIRVNCISPGYMDTALNRVPALDAQKVIWVGRTPQERLGAVDDLNGLAVFLASDASRFMTGSNVLIDGGYTLW